MNATFHLSHHHMISQLSALLQVGAHAVDRSANLPKSATSTHYGPDGKRVSSRSTTSYANVRLSKQGQIAGGRIEHSAVDEHGAPMNSSDIALTQDGHPGVVSTDVNNRFGSGVFKRVETDLTRVSWTAAASIHSGEVTIRTRHAASNAIRMEGRITFDNEIIQSGSYAHHACAGDGAIHNYTDVDYSNAKTVGNRIVGGYCAIDFKDARRATLSRSNMFMSPLGRVQQVHTKNFDTATAALKSQVVTNFESIQFDELNQFLSGDAVVAVRSPEGALQSEATTTFENGVPRKTVIENYRGEKPWLKVITDFQSAAFNNDLKVVDSQTVTSAYDADGRMISKTTVTYDADGNCKNKCTQRFKPGSQSVASTIDVDYASTEFDFQGEPIRGFAAVTTQRAGSNEITRTEKHFSFEGGQDPALVAAPEPPLPPLPPQPKYRRQFSTVTSAAGKTTAKSAKTFRSDGTLLQSEVTQFDGEKPVSTTITTYATDGKTIINSDSVDLTQLSYDATHNVVSGHASIVSKFRGTTPSATSKLEF